MEYDYRADPILAETLAYWRRQRGERAMPSRRDIDPIEIPKLLPHLQLVEVIGARFRYRLIGTALAQAFGRDYTGAYPEEVSSAARAEAVCRIYRLVQEKRRPVFLRSSYVGAKNVDLIVNRLYLPLADDDRAVNMILGSLTFEFLQPLADAWGSAERALFETAIEVIEVPLTSAR
ncbi:MAG TPA: PAS domain-containing protein [Stellaceae bacterium]|nr:PAS domain-containing protein [Stellaceae bacterium]